MADTKRKFGSIISGLKTESLYVLLQPIVYCARRLLFVMALREPIFSVQWGGMVICVMFQIVYYLDAKPYYDKLMGGTELVNELFLLGLIYTLPTFTSFIPNDKYKLANYRFGWVFLSIMAPLFLFNCGIVFVEAVAIFLEKRKRSRR